jgi:peptidoglycan/LPS O-acetylase OafA/YrhL
MPCAPPEQADSYKLRLPALDGLRGLAILLVLAHNLQLFDSPRSWAGRVTEFGLNLGWIGVQLFFVLSGFLITRILMDTRDAPNYFQSFFARRALRIFPIYYLTLVFLLLVLPALTSSPNSAVPTWPYWLYLANWTQPSMGAAANVPHLWSLAVEEQFYLIWPLLLHRRSSKTTWWLCLAMAAISLLARIAMLVAEVNPDAIYTFTFCRMDALALGGAGAAALRIPHLARRLEHSANRLGWAATAVFVLGFVATRGYPRTNAIGQSLGYSALAFAFALLVVATACADRDRVNGAFRVLRNSWLRTLGTYSYAIYLFHKPLHDLIGHPALVHLGLDVRQSVAINLVYVTVGLGVSWLLARLSYAAVEGPFLRMKSGFAADSR